MSAREMRETSYSIPITTLPPNQNNPYPVLNTPYANAILPRGARSATTAFMMESCPSMPAPQRTNPAHAPGRSHRARQGTGRLRCAACGVKSEKQLTRPSRRTNFRATGGGTDSYGGYLGLRFFSAVS